MAPQAGVNIQIKTIIKQYLNSDFRLNGYTVCYTKNVVNETQLLMFTMIGTTA